MGIVDFDLAFEGTRSFGNMDILCSDSTERTEKIHGRKRLWFRIYGIGSATAKLLQYELLA